MFKVFISILFFYNVALAQSSLTVVAVGEAEVVADKFLVESMSIESAKPNEKQLYQGITEIIKNDLRFYHSFFDIEKASTLSKSFSSDDIGEYKSRGISYVLKTSLNSDQARVNYKLLDITKNTTLLNTNVLLNINPRFMAHSISNAVYKAITGNTSIFLDKIVFVSDFKQAQGVKELFIMDFDGANPRQLTFHKGLVISPSVSPNGRKILYSLIDNKRASKEKNNNLMMLDLDTGKSEVISNRAGINSGAIFASNGVDIFLTMSIHGNAEIYKMSLETKQIQRLTNNYAPDVDPSINADGSILTFLSGRPGNPMIYTMSPTGQETNVKRISFVGQFNATPRFSPNGREIVFSSWLDERFDLFKINSDGSGLGRLTKDFGSNEDPDYSKDGQFIIFTNQRVISRSSAVQNIYIMDIEGKILGALTQNVGKCIGPRWAKSSN